MSCTKCGLFGCWEVILCLMIIFVVIVLIVFVLVVFLIRMVLVSAVLAASLLYSVAFVIIVFLIPVALVTISVTVKILLRKPGDFMRECFNCEFYGLILDESDLPRYGCKNVQSPYYLVWVCSDDYCSRYVPSAEVCKSCDTCVHSTCNTQSDKDACLSCFGTITNYSNYVSVARAVTEKCVSSLVSGDPF